MSAFIKNSYLVVLIPRLFHILKALLLEKKPEVTVSILVTTYSPLGQHVRGAGIAVHADRLCMFPIQKACCHHPSWLLRKVKLS